MSGSLGERQAEEVLSRVLRLSGSLGEERQKVRTRAEAPDTARVQRMRGKEPGHASCSIDAQLGCPKSLPHSSLPYSLHLLTIQHFCHFIMIDLSTQRLFEFTNVFICYNVISRQIERSEEEGRPEASVRRCSWPLRWRARSSGDRPAGWLSSKIWEQLSRNREH